MLVTQIPFAFTVSTFPPPAVAFFGLGTGYLIYGPGELFGFPKRSPSVDRTTGLWGIWMPGFMHFLTGMFLFVGLAWFHTFVEKPLYMAAVAFTAYGVHWFAIGAARYTGSDPKPNGFMSIAFTMISALGIVVFFKGGDWPVGTLFCGLTLIYISDFFASLKIGMRTPSMDTTSVGDTREPHGEVRTVNVGEMSLGFWHLLTGLWLMYLTWATVLNLASGLNLPL